MVVLIKNWLAPDEFVSEYFVVSEELLEEIRQLQKDGQPDLAVEQVRRHGDRIHPVEILDKSFY